MRGGEKVLAAIAEMFPGADIYTHAYMPAEVPCFGSHRVRETFIASLPFGRRHPQIYLPLMPCASRRLDLDGYDLVISSESGPVKGIRKPEGAKHLCYCHTPMRYVWDMYSEYYREAGFCGKLAMKMFVRHLRRKDLESADSVDLFVANSKFVAGRIKRIYGRDAVVVNPPVDVEFFRGEYAKRDYYLYAGADVKYKRLDLARAACERMGRKLVVAGGGRSSPEELRRAYGEAKALLFPGVEDFGIVPVEAQAAGTPVIAFGKGGALETVKDGESGLFFGEQTVESLCGAIEEFESRRWQSESCVRNSLVFAPEVFSSKLRAAIDNLI